DPALRALEKTYAEEATLAPEVTSFLERARARLASEAGVRSIELLALYCMVLEPVSLRDALEMLMLAGARDARHEVHRAYEVIRTVLVDVGNGRFTVFHGAFRDYVLQVDEYDDSRFHRFAGVVADVRHRLMTWCERWSEHRGMY